MFKRFLFNTLSSFTGAIIALVIAGVAVAAIIGGVISSFAGDDSKPEVKPGSILTIDLNGDIAECEKAFSPDFSMLMQGKFEAPQNLPTLINAVREAVDNKDIVAIYLKCDHLSAQPATLDALRHELLKFKEQTGGKKKIIAYANDFNTGAYFVASVADSIYLNPAGDMSLSGLTVGKLFYKELLDKLGVEFQVAKVGTYKSAVEPYLMQEMSEPARAQEDTLLTNQWKYIRDNIAKVRKGISPADIDTLISRKYIAYAKPELAVKSHLVDELLYERTVKERLAKLAGCEVEKLNLVDPSTVTEKKTWGDAYDAKNRIAIVYAYGEIADGNDNEVNYEKLVPVITELADDDEVKGLVLRVNSPGGSVYGSDQIAEALDYFKTKGKPFVVSMGDFAASGGYWISATADRIFADPLTITGSIGIFGLFPNVKGSLEKIGVNFQMIGTNSEADFPTLFTRMDESQMAVMQDYVERGYDEFISRVATGRKLPKEKVLAIAEGRVWDAQSAVKIGLVDQLGYLQDAIDYVAKKAKTGKDYNLATYPKFEPSLFDSMMAGGVSVAELNDAVKYRKEEVLTTYMMNRILSRNPIQSRICDYYVRW